MLYSPVHYPTDYGFVDETLEEDGDPIDILVLVSNPTVPGCIVDTRIIGVLVMSDDKGVDNKLLGVAQKDPRYAQVATSAGCRRTGCWRSSTSSGRIRSSRVRGP